MLGVLGLQGKMPLHAATREADAAMVKLLLTHGADLGVDNPVVSPQASIAYLVIHQSSLASSEHAQANCNICNILQTVTMIRRHWPVLDVNGAPMPNFADA